MNNVNEYHSQDRALPYLVYSKVEEMNSYDIGLCRNMLDKHDTMVQEIIDNSNIPNTTTELLQPS